MKKWLTSLTVIILIFAGVSVPSRALDFTADRVTHSDEGFHYTQFFITMVCGDWNITRRDP